VALVGFSGCGKSTAAALIERFYDPLSGVILVDGIRVQEYTLTDYRNNIGLVSQEPTYYHSTIFSKASLYQGTIRFNILLGTVRSVSQDELDQVCRDANVVHALKIPLTM
jgi:ATP-binding cassette, subfamily B (MDR/TAP), member 1